MSTLGEGSSLLSLLADDPDQFRTSFPAEPLLSRRHPEPLRMLMNFSSVNRLLTQSVLGTEVVELTKNGRRIPKSKFTGEYGFVSTTLIAAELEAGATLLLNQVHRAWHSVATACRQLEHEVGAAVTANAFVSPAKAQGFGHHYDSVSIFVIQTEGSKVWRLFQPTWPFPLTYQTSGDPYLTVDDVQRMRNRAPDYEYILHPGDVLWIPRGWVHYVTSTDEPSMHLAVGITETSRHALVRSIICDALGEDESFRRDLPVGFARSKTASEDVTRELLEALAGWIRQADPERLAAKVRSTTWSSLRGPTPEPVSSAVTGIDASLPSDIYLLPETVCGVSSEDGYLVIHLGDRTLTFTGTARTVVEKLLEAPGIPTAIADLESASTAEAADAVTRRLLAEGVAVPSGRPGASSQQLK